MKKIISIVTVLLFCLLPVITIAEESGGPPDPGGDPTGGSPPLGGGAPIGSGLTILIGLGVAYGGRKTYKFYQEKRK